MTAPSGGSQVSLRTPLCDVLGIDAPIVSAPMGPDLTGAELVAAVSGAGAFGILQAQLHPPPALREEIARVRAATSRPFGVNFLLQFPCEDGLAVALEEHVAAISFFWGDATPYVDRIHAAGARVIVQVGSVADAERAVAGGADVVIAQGAEAGGHVAGQVSTMVLVPRVVDAVGAKVPVVAAGGIADARGVVAALALGASGAALGTRFLASAESRAHPAYKERVVAASEEDTVRTILFGNGWPHAPHRALRTPFVDEWTGNEARAQESRPDEPLVGTTRIGGNDFPVPRFMGLPPNRDAQGDLQAMGMLAGQSAGLIHDVRPAGDIVREIVAEARKLIAEKLAAAVR